MSDERKRRAFELVKQAHELLHAAWPILPCDEIRDACAAIDRAALEIDRALQPKPSFRCVKHGEIPMNGVYEAESGGYGHTGCWQCVEPINGAVYVRSKKHR